MILGLTIFGCILGGMALGMILYQEIERFNDSLRKNEVKDEVSKTSTEVDTKMSGDSLVIKTGYERVKCGEVYFTEGNGSVVSTFTERNSIVDEKYYDNANYHSYAQLADFNSRADKLFRQLRRFAVEHRVDSINWKVFNQKKYFIYFDRNELCVGWQMGAREFGTLYFDSEETARLAIEEFKNELTWYFTEYKDCV